MIYIAIFIGTLVYLIGLWHFVGWVINTIDRHEEMERAATRVAREQSRGELRARTSLYADRGSDVVWLPTRNDTRPAA